MPRYIKYPILAFFVAAVVYFAANIFQALTLEDTEADVPARGVVQASETPQPNYLITDGAVKPK